MDPIFVRAVYWRERLIVEGFDAVEAFVAEYPDTDRQALKRMIQKAQSMRHKHGTPRFLLRHIRNLEEAKRRVCDEASGDQARVPPTVS
jgi:ribosome-associated protein